MGKADLVSMREDLDRAIRHMGQPPTRDEIWNALRSLEEIIRACSLISFTNECDLLDDLIPLALIEKVSVYSASQMDQATEEKQVLNTDGPATKTDQDTPVQEQTVEEWLEVRKLAGLEIDPQTAEVMWRHGYTLDPYGVKDLPEEFRQLGREYFARAPGSDIFVSFDDLPDHTRSALWKRPETSTGNFVDDLPAEMQAIWRLSLAAGALRQKRAEFNAHSDATVIPSTVRQTW